MSRVIDLNADMGEYANDQQRDVEAALMALITSCSIACGGHAGDEETMRTTAQLAKKLNVSIGAHPSYPDREGFGRRSLSLAPGALRQSLEGQIAALTATLDTEGMTLSHVKPHGALYHDAAKDAALAMLIVEAADNAVIVGPPGSALEAAARRAGRAFAAEGFSDRLYQASCALTPRSAPGAIIPDISARAAQALAIASGDEFKAANGAITLSVQTLCIHSDSPGAIETAKAVRAALEAGGIMIEAF